MKEKQLGIDIESLEKNEYETKENQITFEKPKFMREEKEEKITSSQKNRLNAREIISQFGGPNIGQQEKVYR